MNTIRPIPMLNKAPEFEGITVGAPFHEERDDRIGIVTVPGVEITFYNFNGVHGFDSCGLGGPDGSRAPSREALESNGPRPNQYRTPSAWLLGGLSLWYLRRRSNKSLAPAGILPQS
jgi:hypothetical protein